MLSKSLVRKSLVLAGLTVFAACGDSPTEDADSTSSIHQSNTGSARYIVGVKNAAGRAAVARAGDIKVDLAFVGAVAAELPQAAVTALQNNPNIGEIELDPKRTLGSQTTPYGIDSVQASGVSFDAAAPGAKTVCVIDSGYTPGHPDLPSATEIDLGTTWDVDSCGHGTHVAGTIAAIDNLEGVVGVAPSASLLIAKVFGQSGDNACAWVYASDTLAAGRECQAAGADIINMSLGGSFKSKFEERGWDRLHAEGVLSIAAAGNDGNTRKSYPASYPGVVSVAAINSQNEVAAFSQQNDEVELAAPGVGVLSTLPWSSVNEVAIGDDAYGGSRIEETPEGSATGTLIDGGLCDSLVTDATSQTIVLCERGNVSFADKVNNAKAAAAVVIYNNAPEGFAGTCGGNCDADVPPAIGISGTDGAAALTALGQSATVTMAFYPDTPGYEAWDGTSMATPHVAGVAALVWSHAANATNQEIRDALAATALDLGPTGRDNAYGHGLVQAADAIAYLTGDVSEPCVDADSDNYCVEEGDCDDADGSVNPGAEEICGDGIDNDCSGGDEACPVCTDADGDGYCAEDGDCNDDDPAVNPGAAEICGDGIDNDCDGASDEGCDAPTCDLGQVGDPCDGAADCCSNKCKGRPGAMTCK